VRTGARFLKPARLPVPPLSRGSRRIPASLFGIKGSRMRVRDAPLADFDASRGGYNGWCNGSRWKGNRARRNRIANFIERRLDIGVRHVRVPEKHLRHGRGHGRRKPWAHLVVDARHDVQAHAANDWSAVGVYRTRRYCGGAVGLTTV
jgi:hypothetical protein